MDISIIILNYKSKGLVRQCLKNIEKYPISYSHEIIVVDNASDDGIKEMLEQQFPHTIFIDAKANIGYAAGNNLGLKRAKGKVALILNPDIFMKSGAVDTLYEYMTSHKNIGMVGPQLLYPDGSVQASCYRFPNLMIPFYRRTFLGKLPQGKKVLSQYLMHDVSHDHAMPVDWLLGASIMVDMHAVKEVGMLDERFFLYYDDVDWSRQFWEKGYEVHYVPQAQMYHFHKRESDSGSLIKSLRSKVTRIHIQSAIRYYRKYHKKPFPRTKKGET